MQKMGTKLKKLMEKLRYSGRTGALIVVAEIAERGSIISVKPD